MAIFVMFGAYGLACLIAGGSLGWCFAHDRNKRTVARIVRDAMEAKRISDMEMERWRTIATDRWHSIQKARKYLAGNGDLS